MAPYIFGNVFLKNFYTIYDLEERRIGIALHKNSLAKVEDKSHAAAIVIIVIIIIAIGVGLAVYFIKKR
jgi:hypothetical protein